MMKRKRVVLGLVMATGLILLAGFYLRPSRSPVLYLCARTLQNFLSQKVMRLGDVVENLHKHEEKRRAEQLEKAFISGKAVALPLPASTNLTEHMAIYGAISGFARSNEIRIIRFYSDRTEKRGNQVWQEGAEVHVWKEDSMEMRAFLEVLESSLEGRSNRD